VRHRYKIYTFQWQKLEKRPLENRSVKFISRQVNETTEIE